MNNKQVGMDDVIDIIVEKLNRGGTVTFTPKGKSMLPMLRDGEDVVVLSKPKGRLRLFDIPLYRRSDGSYVLHRVVGYDPDGGYVLCGDNQFSREHGIMDKDIIGVLIVFYRKGKMYRVNSPKYRLYVNFWHYTRFPRFCFCVLRNKLNGLKKTKGKSANNEKTTDKN